ncbi:MAG: (d)CMP kinase [Caldilineaceae bacterium]|nr:(d)CMP kinase [Caldilineaceae bacterium]
MDQQTEEHLLDIPIETLMDAEIAAIQRMRPAIVAIDGPAGAGKSTIGHQLAQILDFLFFDTGIMYRAITYTAIERQLTLTDAQAMGELAHSITITVVPVKPEEAAQMAVNPYCYVRVDNVDITAHLRRPEVDRNVSVVSAHALVRRALSEQQRRIGHYYGGGTAEKQGIVMVGRDIGTAVLPDAPLKVFMVASLAERARRRFCEQRKKGKIVTLSTVVDEIARRDRIDSERDLSPLRRAIDAVELDTSEMNTEEVVQAILDIANDLSLIH